MKSTTCPICGKPFIGRDSRARFCPECRSKRPKEVNRYQQKLSYYRRIYQGGPEGRDVWVTRMVDGIRICLMCGKEYNTQDPGAGHYYCSEKCKRQKKMQQNSSYWNGRKYGCNGWDCLNCRLRACVLDGTPPK